MTRILSKADRDILVKRCCIGNVATLSIGKFIAVENEKFNSCNGCYFYWFGYNNEEHSPACYCNNNIWKEVTE